MAARRKAPMPRFAPAPPALVARFEKQVASLPDTELRRMFGYPAAFLAGSMFAGVFRDGVMFRLSEADREAAAKRGFGPFEPMPGRRMREYASAPAEVTASEKKLGEWLARAHAFAKTLPPKAAKPARAKAASMRARVSPAAGRRRGS
jgi:TfoX/Sxy family transcriptional regulator of competence genes